MLICSLILTHQLFSGFWLQSAGKAVCMPAALLHTGQLRFLAFPAHAFCILYKKVCAHLCQHSICVTYSAMSLWSQWDYSPATLCWLIAHVCFPCACTEMHPAVLISQKRCESFPLHAKHALHCLYGFAWGNPTSIQFWWSEGLSCPHHPGLFAGQHSPPLPHLTAESSFPSPVVQCSPHQVGQPFGKDTSAPLMQILSLPSSPQS